MARDSEGVVVFAPAPLLTITIERKGEGADVHVHAGGQGFWLARMVAALGVPVTLCASFGGETGAVVRTLIEREGVAVCAVEAGSSNAAYVHDRRSGRREPMVEMAASPLSRHELDDLYGAMLAAGLHANVCLLGGTLEANVIPADTYRRLTSDLRANGAKVIADLTGERLDAVVSGGIDVVKVSDEELVRDGRASSLDESHLLAALGDLRSSGVSTAVISRAGKTSLASWQEMVVGISTPHLEPLDPQGAGDSMTAGIAASLARGDRIEDALRLGAAAASLNVTRSGLATGARRDIEEMARQVELQTLGRTTGHPDAAQETATLDQLAARARP